MVFEAKATPAPVVPSLPAPSVHSQAASERLIDLRERIGLGLAVVPAKSPKRRQVTGQSLLNIDANSV
jgi:hypothetical protein